MHSSRKKAMLWKYGRTDEFPVNVVNETDAVLMSVGQQKFWSANRASKVDEETDRKGFFKSLALRSELQMFNIPVVVGSPWRVRLLHSCVRLRKQTAILKQLVVRPFNPRALSDVWPCLQGGSARLEAQAACFRNSVCAYTIYCIWGCV